MARKPNNMSVAIEPELRDRLDICASNKGLNRSQLLRYLIETFLTEFEVVPVAVPDGLRDKLVKQAEKSGMPIEQFVVNVVEKGLGDSVEMDFPADLLSKLEAAASRKGISVKELVEKTLERYIVDSNDDIAPVVLKIPRSLKGKPEELEQWLDSRMQLIVKNF